MAAANIEGSGPGERLSAGAAILLLLAVLLSLAPGMTTVPPIDRDEPRYTQATKQMMETGDYVRIRFQDAPRHKKPIGIHWLQAGAAQTVGDGAASPLWIYRIPSLAGALAAVLLAVWAARAFLPLGPALVVGLIFGTTIILGVEARLAKTDAALLASILAAQGALARVWLSQRRSWAMPLVFWLALSAGVLIKGPIAPMVIGLTLLGLVALQRDNWRVLLRLRPVTGLVITAALCLPWYIAIYFATDGAFYAAAVGRDFLGKAATGQEGHWAPPLAHLAVFFAVAWPLSAFAVAAFWRIWRRREPVFVYCLAWVVPAWIVFELVPTKLPHYTLPMVPGVAIAVVAALGLASPPRVLRILAGLMILAVPLGVVVAIPIGFVLFETPIPWIAVAVAALAAIAGLAGGLALIKGAPALAARVVAPTVAAAAIAQSAVWGLALPALEPVWVSPRLVATVQDLSPCEDPRVVSIGFNEPSMIFLSATDTALEAPEPALTIAAQECAIIASRQYWVEELEAAAKARGLPLVAVGTVEGFNISKGHWLNLNLYTVQK
ncbi:MAG: glycosyltransferase family 39 protein [Pseudomonadota bacterium]